MEIREDCGFGVGLLVIIPVHDFSQRVSMFESTYKS
jgi:hypothetical protein